MEQQIKREEVIFDATVEVTGVYGDEIGDRDIDSRDVFMEIRKFADFWMTAYEPLIGTLIPEDEYLEYVTLATLSWFKGYLGHDMTDKDELRLCNNQRVAQYCLNHGMNLWDYDYWSSLEEVVGEPMTYEEYYELAGTLLDSPISLAVCEGNRKDLKAKLERIRNPMVRYKVKARISDSRETWVEVPKSAGMEAITEVAMHKFLNQDDEEDQEWERDAEDICVYFIDYASMQEV